MATIAGVKMASMAKPKESLNANTPGKISPDPYSYEHRISLDQDAMDKLGVTETPKVGDVFHVMGEGHVHSVSSNSALGGKPNLQVSLQMRKLGVQKKAQAMNGKPGTPKATGALAAVNSGIKEAE